MIKNNYFYLHTSIQFPSSALFIAPLAAYKTLINKT